MSPCEKRLLTCTSNEWYVELVGFPLTPAPANCGLKTKKFSGSLPLEQPPALSRDVCGAVQETGDAAAFPLARSVRVLVYRRKAEDPVSPAWPTIPIPGKLIPDSI